MTDYSWTCPNCGDDGILMDRAGSKDTCQNCLFVVGGDYNDHELSDYDLTYRQGQRLLFILGWEWSGTPGDVENRLRGAFSHPAKLNAFLADIRSDTDG